MAIYLSDDENQNQIASMLKYAEEVRELAFDEGFPAAKSYDEAFIIHKKSCNFTWDYRSEELYKKAQKVKNSRFRDYQSNKPQNRKQQGKCYRFANTGNVLNETAPTLTPAQNETQTITLQNNVLPPEILTRPLLTKKVETISNKANGSPDNYQYYAHFYFNDKTLCTPVYTNVLQALLYGYDKIKYDYLVNGFKNGFDLIYNGNREDSVIVTNNHHSALKMPEIVISYITKELTQGRLSASK
ncbi:unnamed protein product [Owenia fusiformis]|uniref:Uncharacterized protein n=1 Tax=Owenia fusiformis TaxID=6347 RepID=A0A8S4PWW2_OWEFU|nr:unnamed protein product [Owenia fusiformis]